MKISIVTFTPSDQPLFKHLVLEGFKEFGFEFMSKYDSDLDDPSIYTKTGGELFLAKLGGKIIGSLAVINLEDSQAELKRFYVDKKFQNKGIGSALFEHALDFCKNNGFIRIEFETNRKFKKAHQFYSKRGFKVFKEDDRSFYMEKEI